MEKRNVIMEIRFSSENAESRLYNLVVKISNPDILPTVGEEVNCRWLDFASIGEAEDILFEHEGPWRVNRVLIQYEIAGDTYKIWLREN